ncbi:hypothetical protein BJY54_006071 [Streptomyces nodosus]|uniref:Uncharacterized protein n=1 Tax=Streptomyces nodosus TaxID=40318 RepID=A0A0B5DUQ0_9ACTN|nr:hypothetical protein SNOD_30820 [Streptomyces nodosus]MBB4795459.1 hypothetical protein [Streptomyces nodosus]
MYPNLWAGVGLVRGGAGTALVGSHAEVGAYWFGEGVIPERAARGLLQAPATESGAPLLVAGGR